MIIATLTSQVIYTYSVYVSCVYSYVRAIQTYVPPYVKLYLSTSSYAYVSSNPFTATHLFLSIVVFGIPVMCWYLYSSIMLLARSISTSGVQSAHRSNIAMCLLNTNFINTMLSSLAIVSSRYCNLPLLQLAALIYIGLSC